MKKKTMKMLGFLVMTCGLSTTVLTTVGSAEEKVDLDPKTEIDSSAELPTEYTNYWSDAPWTFSSDGILTIQGGTIDLDHSTSPWQSGMVPYQEIKEIKFDTTVYLKGNAKGLFFGLFNLEKINAENLNVDEVTTISLMFNGLAKLTSIDLSTWNTRTISDTLGMFGGTSNLKEITLGSDSVFAQNILIDSQIEGYTSRLIGKNTGKIYSSSFDLVANYDGNTPDTFVREKLEDVEVKSWGTANYEYSDGNLIVSGGSIDLANDLSPWDSKEVAPTEIKRIYLTDTVHLTGDASYLFASLPNLQHADLEKLDVSQVTSMKGMFLFSKILSFTIADWNVSNVTDMSYMFQGTQSLQELNLEKWNTSNVTNMSYMFANATILQKLSISQWDVSNVTDMSYMFLMTKSLSHADLSSWDLNDKTINGMFLGAAHH